MKIGLIDVDGHNFPNLALMKLSAYHKQQGDSVEFVKPLQHYDIVYKAKVFTFTTDSQIIFSADQIVKGGTGYGMMDELFCDKMDPDFSIYPLSDWYDGKTSYGFLTRGCIRNCYWCIVPKKEGSIKPYRDIEQVLKGNARAVLMDNNILAYDYGLQQLEKIIDLGCRVDFNQGLDARLVSSDIAYLLSKVKWIGPLRFACDTKEQYLPLHLASQRLNRFGVKNSKLFVYVLLKDLYDSYERINQCKKLGVDPFAQPYRDFTGQTKVPKWQRDMARWCNHKAIFNTVDFMDYEPRKGFKCSEYFKEV